MKAFCNSSGACTAGGRLFQVDWQRKHSFKRYELIVIVFAAWQIVISHMQVCRCRGQILQQISASTVKCHHLFTSSVQCITYSQLVTPISDQQFFSFSDTLTDTKTVAGKTIPNLHNIAGTRVTNKNKVEHIRS